MKRDDGGSLFAPLRERLDALGKHARESIALRWELARLEIDCDLRTVRRFTVVLVICLLGILTSLPLLVLSLVYLLDGVGGIGMSGWSAIVGGGLFVLCLLIAWLAWRRCRAKFVGLEETLEELREDAEWLGEWFEKSHREEADS